MNKPFSDISVLLLIFNRPDSTLRVFEAIRKAKPARLFIAADGPRPGVKGEVDVCEQTRSVVSRIDWNCELHTLFRETNLGCRSAVSSAITWFFEHVEEGIILEDDCLPDDSFFRYCAELLDKYRDDERIMHIAGHNFQFGRKIGSGTYYFSQLCHIWGWASWKRVWTHYHPDMPDYPAFVKQNALANIFSHNDMRKYYSVLFDQVYKNKINTWDYQLSYAILKNNGLCIIPNENLVENIGFTDSGSHTSFPGFSFIKKLAVHNIYSKLMGNVKKKVAFPLIHPVFVIPEQYADHQYFRSIVYFFFMRIYLIYMKYFR